MTFSTPEEFWFLIAGVAIVSFFLGRRSASSGDEGSAALARMQQQENAQRAFAELSPSTQAEIDQLLAANKIIPAIKVLREATGLGLRDAKIAIDRRRAALEGEPIH